MPSTNPLSPSFWASKIAGQYDVITNIANNLIPVEKLLTGGAYLLGLFFTYKALQSLKSHGEMGRNGSQQGSSMKEPIVYFLVAAALLYFPTVFSILMNTTFGYNSVLSYQTMNSQNQTINTLFGSGSEVGHSLSIIIRVIGLAAFIRGWLLIARGASHGQQPGNTAKGLTHIFGGILAMNIMGTLQVLNNTLYGTG